MRVPRDVMQAAVLALGIAAVSFAQDVSRMDQVVETYIPRQFMGSVVVARG